MNLIIDIGNTRVKLGVFDQRNLRVKKIVKQTDFEINDIKDFEKQFLIDKIILTNSGNVAQEILDYLKQKSQFILFDTTTTLPIQNNYATPTTLGKDRLAGAVAAKFFFPNEHCLVIDCGTSTTYNFVTDKGAFLGGSISLGLSMRFEALHEFTAKLPLIEKGNVDNLVGNNTETAIRTGVQLGAINEMEGFIDTYVQRFGKIRTLLTGGESDYFVKHLKSKIFALENLVLTGLNEILIFNTENK